ncbi:hypothetical protein NDI37_10715 [Funiculus sociatus GB2-A5]|uniref:DUF998 domain-containing protein n=1 Tax=Funiculus sociatus GB2-A5 TaxID=2933946 RepID=A0ABV0JND5_9CYAN|nr:hypothetical protein [Trichocoleus sp. FACHB-832]
MQIILFKKLWQESKKQIAADRFIIIFNGLTVLLFFALSIYAKLWGKGRAIEFIFADPFSIKRPYYGFLTSVSEIIWCIGATTCLFSFSLLKSIHPKRKGNLFILCSALGLFALLADDLFRITLILNGTAGVPKIVMYLVYGVGAIAYGFLFRHRLVSTPYILLLVGGLLFAISCIVDVLPIQGQGTPAMLEDGTKLLGIINITFYFWHVCCDEILHGKYGIRVFKG